MSRYAPLEEYGSTSYSQMSTSSSSAAKSAGIGGKVSGFVSSLSKPVLIAIAVVAVVVVALAIGLGVGLSSQGGVALRASTPGTLLVAESGQRSSGTPRIVARSYDGLAWEAMRDHDMLPARVECATGASSGCRIFGVGKPTIREVPVPGHLLNATAEGLAARLLQQTTFGPTSAELAAATNHTGGAAGWIADQMALPPSLLREYIRARQNPTNADIADMADLIGICDLGSRWANVTDGGSAANTQTFADANLDLVPVGQGGTDFAVARVVGCDATKITGTEAYINHRGQRYRFRPRIKLLQNTLAAPAGGTVGAMCPAVTKTFLNAPQCVRRASCGAPAASSVALELNNATLRRWFTGSQRYVYVVTGLRFQDSFADANACEGASRWLRKAGACANPSNLNAATMAALTTALQTSTDTNPFVRDINIAGAAGCAATTGISITVDNICWTHIHMDEMTVRDFTAWGTGGLHPGGDQNIRKWAETPRNSVELPYPGSHPMSRWVVDNLVHIPALGRWGDSIDFQGLPTSLQTPDMATFAGASNPDAGGSFESCGSPGEGPNNGIYGHLYLVKERSQDTTEQRNQLDWRYDFNQGKSMAWINHVLKAPDQLRQRVAWALQQIFTVADNQAIFRDSTEVWGSYYDIFVRHAFGSYLDILKEVTYHPLMSVYLTYRGSESYQRTGRRPDENYAREIMQLFSIGLYKLNEDGTAELSPEGTLIDSYTDVDIVDYARIFTGFDRQPDRSNIERVDGGDDNGIDPLQIKPLLRDRLPKAKLDAGYIGDQYPLCNDLPAQPWRRAGAKFLYTGTSSIEGNGVDTTDRPGRPRFAPAPDSALYNLLCGPKNAADECTFPSEITLTETVACDAAECDAEDVVSVKIVRGAQIGYFTYIRQPCVQLTLFQEGRMLQYNDDYQCGDHLAPIGNPQCCRKTDPDRQGSTATTAGLCPHINERATFATVKARCEAADLVMCSGRRRRYPTWATSCAQEMPTWVDEPCVLKVQIQPNGRVAVVDVNGTVAMFRESNGNIFRVRWANDVYPLATNPAGCGPGCIKVNTTTDDTCVCSVNVTTRPLFSEMPSAETVRNTALIGAPPVTSFDANTYTLCETPECTADPKLKVWVKTGFTWGNETTIFETSHFAYAGDTVRYFKNQVSTVALLEQGEMSFRNPPRFMPLLGEFPVRTQPYRGPDLYLPNAEREVQALLDHLSFHQNTAPFVAYRMIQRLVTSNPSLRYVKAVVDAFKTGQYGGRTYSGKYGDMGATVAAVLLDQEARSHILEADSLHGSLREPMLKVLHLLRSMEYKSKDGREVHLPSMFVRIGENAFQQPSVFGFYLPDFRPAGPVEDSGLVAPEAMIMDTPASVHYFNGMTSLIDDGLTACNRGFGYNYQRSCGNQANRQRTNDGELQYRPADSADVTSVINHLDMLLTANRMAPETKLWLEGEYRAVLAVDGEDDARKHLLKLIISTIEYQTNTALILLNSTRVAVPPPPPNVGGRGFRAVVVVFEGGGADSWNLIVPRNGCGRDYYAEYQGVRTGAAIDKGDLLPINVPGQVCTEFGVHPNMGALQQLYNDGDAAFYPNIGGLVEPMTRAEYDARTKLRPPSPTAHDIAQRTLQNLHAQNSNAKGVLGRAVDALIGAATPYRSGVYSLAGNAKMVQGVVARPDIISATEGVVQLTQKNLITAAVTNVTKFYGHNILGETYSDLVGVSLKRTDEIAAALETADDVPQFGSGWNAQLRQVAKLIKIRETLGTERAVFFTSRGGWDTHTSHNPPWAAINDGLNKFATEMKAQGVWDDVTVVSVSDFGRTLTSNGDGTDHAWGGNHFIAGGSVKGGRFHGSFPPSLALDSELNINNRGRILPTSGWETMWSGILQWMDVPADKMGEVLPNLERFPADKLTTRQDVFEN